MPQNPTAAVLCERRTPGPPQAAWEQDPVAQRQLRDGAVEFVTLLNRARTAEAQLAADRERAVREGRDPAQVELGCNALGYPTVISFELRYPDGHAVPMLVNQNCASLYADGRTRFYGGLFDPVEEFLRRYRDLLATADPATIATPACAESIPADRLDRRELPSGPATTLHATAARWRTGCCPTRWSRWPPADTRWRRAVLTSSPTGRAARRATCERPLTGRRTLPRPMPAAAAGSIAPCRPSSTS